MSSANLLDFSVFDTGGPRECGHVLVRPISEMMGT
jgi:hypothetical protein